METESPRFTFGLMADNPLLFGRKEIKGGPSHPRSRHYLKTPDRLKEAIQTFQQYHCFPLRLRSLGDSIDRGFESYDVPIQIMEEESSFRWLGNHEFSAVGERQSRRKAEPQLGTHWECPPVTIILTVAICDNSLCWMPTSIALWPIPKEACSKLYKESRKMKKHFQEQYENDKDNP